MDNRKIDVIYEGEDRLADAIRLGWDGRSKATHYAIVRLKRNRTYCPAMDKVAASHYDQTVIDDKDGVLTLVLLWADQSPSTKLPYPMPVDEAVGFVRGWLRNGAELGPEPDHDGSNKRGWRVFTEDWGHVGPYSYSIFGVQAIWAMYGK